MTNERSDLIANVLLEDQEYAKKLFALSPEAAAAELAGKGYDITADELIEFKQELEKTAKLYSENGELDEETLASVSGGCTKCFTAGLWTVAVGVTVVGMMW